MPNAYWPLGLSRDDSVPTFIKMFEGLGYSVCENGNAEQDVEKVAIYADAMGHVKHAARQMRSGMWTSKLGRNVDIAHEPSGLEGNGYGDVCTYMARRRMD